MLEPEPTQRGAEKTGLTPNIGPRFLAIAAIGVATVIACTALTIPSIELLNPRSKTYDRPLNRERLALPEGFPIVWSVPPFVVCYSKRQDALLRDDGNGLRLSDFDSGGLLGRFPVSADMGAADSASDLLVTVSDRIRCWRSNGSVIGIAASRLPVASVSAYRGRIAVAEWDGNRSAQLGQILIWHKADDVGLPPDVQITVPQVSLLRFGHGQNLAFCTDGGLIGIVDDRGKAIWSARFLEAGSSDVPVALEWSADGKSIVVATRAGSLRTFGITPGGTLSKAAMIDPDTRGMVFLPDGKMLFACGQGELVLRDSQLREVGRAKSEIGITGLAMRKGEALAFHGGYK